MEFMSDEVKPQDNPPVKKRRWVRPCCILMIIAVSITIGAGALCWRLAQGPFHVGFLIPIVEKTLSADDGLSFKIGSLNMVWRGGTTPLGFDMRDLHVKALRAIS